MSVFSRLIEITVVPPSKAVVSIKSEKNKASRTGPDTYMLYVTSINVMFGRETYKTVKNV